MQSTSQHFKPLPVDYQLYQRIADHQIPHPTRETVDESININRSLSILAHHRWLIMSIVLLMTLAGVIYVLVARPKYEANILVQIDESIVQPRNLLSDFTGTPAERKGGIATEMEVIRSRTVLSRVVEKTNAYIEVRPKYFPLIGSWIANLNMSFISAAPSSGAEGRKNFYGYVWADESASVSIFNVPQRLEGEKFILTAESNNVYRVQQLEHGIDFRANTGDRISIPAMGGSIDLRVDRIVANPGAQFFLTRQPKITAIDKLEKSLKISEKGKQSGIINIRLLGTDPREISNVLNEIGNEYIRQTINHKADEAERSLLFLNQQLPKVKQELESAEAKYNQIRKSNSTVNLDEESKDMVQRVATLETRMLDLKQRRQDLSYRFENTHPSMELINSQISDLAKEINTINEKIKRMPSVEQDVLRATRDVKVNTELYTNLLSTAQQLRQISASRLGGFRLLDAAAVPAEPVGPPSWVVIVFTAVLGAILGIVAAFAKNKMHGQVLDPQTLEYTLGVPVAAKIPHSPQQKNLYSQIQNKAKKISVLPYVATADSAVEGLRSFRTVLDATIAERNNNIILITGPSPEVGKSFVSANMANMLASIGKKVLLIDGDMRTGYLHRYFGLERTEGLSDIITGKISADQVIHREVVKNVDFISTGALPDTPAELLADRNFKLLLQSLSSSYDFILVDTAPVLAFSDAMIVAAQAGAIYTVVRAGVSTVDEIEETVRCLTQAGGKVMGTIFNDVKGRSAYRYGYGSRYQKHYQKVAAEA